MLQTQELLLSVTSFLLQGSLGPMALGMVSRTEGTVQRLKSRDIQGLGRNHVAFFRVWRGSTVVPQSGSSSC